MQAIDTVVISPSFMPGLASHDPARSDYEILVSMRSMIGLNIAQSPRTHISLAENTR